jgi:hypothetical protein
MRRFLSSALAVLSLLLASSAARAGYVISRFDTAGKLTGSVDANIIDGNYPRCLVFDGSGGYWVCSSARGHGSGAYPTDLVLHLDSTGKLLGSLKGGAADPGAFATAANGISFVEGFPDGGYLGEADLFRIDASGSKTLVTLSGSYMGARFPSILVSSAGRLYANTRNPGGIFEYDPTSGAVLRQVSFGSAMGASIAFDPTGAFIWSYSTPNGSGVPTLARYDLNLVVQATYNVSTVLPAGWYGGIAVLPDGRVAFFKGPQSDGASPPVIANAAIYLLKEAAGKLNLDQTLTLPKLGSGDLYKFAIDSAGNYYFVRDANCDGLCPSGTLAACQALVCDAPNATCTVGNQPDGKACDDSNACTKTDICHGGACVGSNPVVCVASDQCHAAGVCDTGSGVCSNPAKADGAICDDGNACTRTDTCKAGACAGANPVTCTASDQCHVAGTCSPVNGACSNPAAADGATCDDANACTSGDACKAGVCQGAATSCPAVDECHAGLCDPKTGCGSTPQPDGTVCSVGSCQAGSCVAPKKKSGCASGGDAPVAALLLALALGGFRKRRRAFAR